MQHGGEAGPKRQQVRAHAEGHRLQQPQVPPQAGLLRLRTHRPRMLQRGKPAALAGPALDISRPPAALEAAGAVTWHCGPCVGTCCDFLCCVITQACSRNERLHIGRRLHSTSKRSNFCMETVP